ncbi:MAG: tripartite tricarboxylate transporter substrate-binding protein [Acidocella sp.]|nr:tripartite tricarboxylate transporter substrate-binding protein [Acidocella sp.]
MSNIVLKRRTLFPMAAAFGAATSAGITSARAAGFPSQTINLIIPYGPGGGFDAYGRKFAQLLQTTLPNHVNVVPLNVPGAAGKEAIFQLQQDKPDGYNVSIINVPGILLGKKNGNLQLDKLSWIANLGRDSYGLAVAAKGPIKTVADLQALSAKRALKFSSTGSGSTDFLATKMFAAALGLNVSLVSGYNDSPNSVVAVARGDVDAVVHSLTTLQDMEKSGLAKIIFVFQRKSPIPGIEDATTLGQPDLGNIFQWRPIVGPPGMDPATVDILSKAFVAAAFSPAAKAWAEQIKTTLYPLDSKGTVAMIAAQRALVDNAAAALK